MQEEDRENLLCSYETPYVIWANGAAAELLDWESAVEALDLPEDGRLSASFLGAALVELTGRENESAWFRFLNDLRRVVPVVQKKTYVTMDGTCIPDRELDQWAPADGASGRDIRQLIQKWRQWSFYKLRYKEIDG